MKVAFDLQMQQPSLGIMFNTQSGRDVVHLKELFKSRDLSTGYVAWLMMILPACIVGSQWNNVQVRME